jgi:hypothetical protein
MKASWRGAGSFKGSSWVKLGTLLLLGLLCPNNLQAIANDPFKLGVEEKNYREDNNQLYPAYPAPQMIPSQPLNGTTTQTRQPLYSAPPKRAPLNAGAERSVELPPAFLGVWQVQGQRVKVDALPEFSQSAEQAFALSNSQIWTINGGAASGYTLGSNTGVQTPLIVDRVQGTTAFIRYQHPIGNTMAQEAIVMSLLPGGAQFNGLERVSIIKQGLPAPRAKVTYQLVGHRQR